MSYSFKKKTGIASVSGTVIYTVPSSNVLSMIGCRASNKDPLNSHTFHLTIDDVLVSGYNTPIPIGSAIDIMVGSKIIIEPGSVIKAYSDDNNVIDVYISYLEQ